MSSGSEGLFNTTASIALKMEVFNSCCGNASSHMDVIWRSPASFAIPALATLA